LQALLVVDDQSNLLKWQHQWFQQPAKLMEKL
jgi:hypothetical protein